MKNLKIGVVGATGMVGQTFLGLLDESQLQITELRPFASTNSEGLEVSCQSQSWKIQSLHDGCFKGLDVVFFSSGDDISKECAPKAVQDGAYAVDNSAAFRMSDEYPLVVPEINGHLVDQLTKPTIIANPNCSTIQLVVALNPLAKKFGLEAVKVATYQAVSGGGKAAQEELIKQTSAQLTGGPEVPHEVFPHTIAFNALPQIGGFNDQGFCSEEMKIMRETRKILSLPDLPVSAFTVRVPVLNVHSEAVWVTLKNDTSSLEEVLKTLGDGPGLQLVKQAQPEEYPHPLSVSGKHPVFVGRVHQDFYDSKTYLMWVVADNILKGAALNGLQIAQKIFQDR